MFIVCSCKHAHAHGLHLDIQILSTAVIKGGISFSDEDGATDQYIRIENLTDTKFTTIILQSNKYGEFMFAGMPGHRYRITVEGDEDHIVSEEVFLIPSVTSNSPEK